MEENNEPVDNPMSAVYRNQIIIAKVIGLLSAMGSGYIIYSMVIKHRRKKLDRTFDRLLLGLCVSDLVWSLTIFICSWTIPATPPEGFEDVVGIGFWDDMFPQAAGSTMSCTVQGFFKYVGSCASVLFTGCIALSFLLQVKFQFRERQMRIAERVFFGFCTVVPIVAAIIIIADQGFNPHPMGFCTLTNSPMICLYQEDAPPEFQEYCTQVADIRGKHVELYIILFVLLPIFSVFFIIIISMGMIFWSVRTQELRVSRFSMAAAAGRDRKRVLIKGMLYTFVFMIVWIPYIVAYFLYHSLPKEIHYIINFFIPLQGVLNVMIYSNLFNVFKKKAVSVFENVRSSLQRSSTMFLGPRSSMMVFGQKAGEGKLKDPTLVSEAVTATSGFQSTQDALDKLDVEESPSELEDDDDDDKKDDSNEIRKGNGEDDEEDEVDESPLDKISSFM